MKKVLKVLGILLGVVVLAALIGFLVISLKGIPSYEVGQIDIKVESNPQRVERGRKLVTTLCAGCHLSRETGKLTGTRMLDAPPEFGIIYSANITQDSEYGIGKWSDGELIYLFRTGIKRDGKYAPPYMAKLPKMADEDLYAIIAFLKSGHSLVAADPTPDHAPEPSFLTKLLSNVAWKPLPMPTEVIELPDTTQSIALGKYLAVNLDCFSCHSADFKTNNFLEPELSAGYFGGGNTLYTLEGKTIQSQNLTPDDSGIGQWTEEQFVKALKSGIKDGEQALRYPMQPYVHLTDLEAKAIFAYLQTIPPIRNLVQRTVIE